MYPLSSLQQPLTVPPYCYPILITGEWTFEWKVMSIAQYILEDNVVRRYTQTAGK